jgi:hypothetical protein
LKALLAPLLVAFGALLSAVGDDVRWCLPVTARGDLLAYLGRAKHDCLIASGALGDDVTRLLKRVPEEVAMFTLLWARCAALGRRSCTIMASSAVSLGLITPFLLP